MGFNLKNRRYFGAKTKLLDNIENVKKKRPFGGGCCK